MKVLLSPGDMLIIGFTDTDGEFRVHFDSGLFPNAVVVEETGGLPDTTGRSGELYREDFSD